MSREVRFGMGRGAVYPHEKAGMLLHPVRRFLHNPVRLAERLNLAPEQRLLEIGPGPGYFSIELAKRLAPGGLVLFDIQREMLQMARDRLSRAGAAAHAIQGDALALPFRDETFDAALLVTVLGEVPQPERCIAEVRRVLAPGGLLCVSEARGDPDRISYGRLRAMAESNGFTPPGAHPGRGWTYTAVFRKPSS